MKLKDALCEAVFSEPEVEKLWDDFKSLPEATKEQVFLKVLVHAKNTQKITIQDLESFVKQPSLTAWGTRKGEQPFTSKGHPSRKSEDLDPKKAKTILRHGEVSGHPLSKKQKGLFGAIAGGSPLKKY